MVQAKAVYVRATLCLINLQVFNGLGRGGREEGREGWRKGGMEGGREGRAKKCKELYTSLLQAFLSVL